MYQARSLIGSDASGLSDPFARVVAGEYCRTTQVIDETLSPTWDELLVFDELLVYGRREDIKANPPAVIVEIYDQDKVTDVVAVAVFMLVVAVIVAVAVFMSVVAVAVAAFILVVAVAVAVVIVGAIVIAVVLDVVPVVAVLVAVVAVAAVVV